MVPIVPCTTISPALGLTKYASAYEILRARGQARHGGIGEMRELNFFFFLSLADECLSFLCLLCLDFCPIFCRTLCILLWRKVFPLWNEFKAQRKLGAWLTIKLGKTRLKWQLACGEEPSLLCRTGIWPLTGTAVDKTELNLVPTAFIHQRIKQQ